MKNFAFLVIAIVSVLFAGTALAEKKPKSTILHCGCTWDGAVAGMAYEEINISAKSRGHDGHLAATMDSCYTGDELVEDVLTPTFSDFVRNGDDCQLDGPPLGDPIAACSDFDVPPEADGPCGVEVL
jgi:hypothetical protein